MAERLIQFIYLDIDTGFYPGAHHGLAALCGAVRAAGHQAALLHVTKPLSPNDFLQAVSPAADVYAFSAMTNQFQFVEQYAPLLAAEFDRPILVGGIHATLAPQAVLQTPGVTWACQGEGDVTIPALLDALSEPTKIQTIGGLWWRDAAGQICHNQPNALTSLGELPDPDYSDFDMVRIVRDLGGRLSVVISRGCPFHCTFCCNDALRAAFPTDDQYVRLRPPADAIRLIAKLVDLYGPTSLRFEDDLLLINRRWRDDFFARYRREIALPYECNCRADMVTPALIELLQASGCVSVDLGIESGEPAIRNGLLGKNISDAQFESAFALLHAAGLETYAYNILGLPYETKAAAKKTLELNRRVKPSAGNVFYFYPYPGTELRQLAEANDLLRDDVTDRKSYTEAPAIKPTHCPAGELQQIYRQLRTFLLLQRFEHFFPLPAWLKRPIRLAAEVAMACCPPLIDWLTTDSDLKRWLRMLAFRVNS